MFRKVNLGPCQKEEEESDDDNTDHDDDEVTENRSQNDRTENLTRRYPVRNRKPLQRYGQNVYES